jgi:hypothetical protein
VLDLLKKLLSREFLITIVVLIVLTILALSDKLTTDLMAALTTSGGVYVWSRTRVKQTNGGEN